MLQDHSPKTIVLDDQYSVNEVVELVAAFFFCCFCFCFFFCVSTETMIVKFDFGIQVISRRHLQIDEFHILCSATPR